MFAFKTIVVFTLLNVSAVSLAQIAPGTQFITGACTSDSDCVSACCGFNSGKCAGAVIAQSRDGGCGFGDSAPNDRAAVAFRAAEAAQRARGAVSSVAPGTQFITGACVADTDCASQCCGFNTGRCAGALVAQDRDGGCGFGEGVPNDRAAQTFRAALAAKAARGGAAPAPQAPVPAPPAQNNAGAAAPPAAGGSGKALGTQFITGPCANDGECASGCCGFRTGRCAGAIVAQERDGGCGFGNATPNDDAARRLRGKRYVAKELLYGH